MKRMSSIPLLFMPALLAILSSSSLDDNGKVHLKVNKEENSKQSLFEKTYTDMDELKADKELREFDISVSDWANSKDGQIKHLFHDDVVSDQTFKVRKIISRDEHVEEVHGIEENPDGKDKAIGITTKDGKKNFTTEIAGEEKGKHHVVVMRDDGNITAEIETEIKKEIGEDGVEKITDHKIRIIKDGKKTELDSKNSTELKTEGDEINITIDGETLGEADFSGGKFEGSGVVVFLKEREGKIGMSETMDIHFEEKSGEQFIEIDIRRVKKNNVTISEINTNDGSLRDFNYDLKNNLKPSQLTYYPNPSTGRFRLKFVLARKEAVTVSIMDILGKEVYKEKIQDFHGSYDNQLDLSGREKGIYILQISQQKKMISRKILIE